MNESNFKLLPDDPKLTAYALGELEGAERAAVEAALRENPALGVVVDEIRAMAAQLETALAAEPAPSVLPAPVPTAPATSKTAGAGKAADPYARKKGAKVLQFPQVYFLVGGLAAAGFAVLVAVRTPTPMPKVEQKHYVEMPLPVIEADKVTEETEAKSDGPEVASGPSADVAKVELPKPGSPELPVFDARASGILVDAKKITDQKLAEVLSRKADNQAAVARAEVARMKTEERRRDEARATALSLTGATMTASGQRVWYYAADEGMVIQAEPTAPSSYDGLALRAPVSSAITGAASAPNASLGVTLAQEEEPIALSPFSVEASRHRGYAAASTFAGTRLPQAGAPREQANTESYAFRQESDFLPARDNPLSTFSADVDTASYANVRRFLENGKRPPVDAVRIEELLNYFPFQYAGPAVAADKRGEAAPFAATMEVAQAPWATNHQLVRIGLKGRDVATAERGAANLVFLLDVSGSMNEPNKLPLVKESMHLLLSKLRPDDRVAIVVYAGASGLALPSTPVKHAGEIAAAIDELRAGGSTNGALGIHLAYDIAKANFVEGGINRVVLCTDGDFNVGTTSEGDLVRLITEKAKSKVFLTALGFGMGNYKDATLQQIADAGNGNYGYVDSRREAEKLLVEQVNGTLVTIAKDVKLQVEFNPAKVASYRLIGYEKRLLKKEDFNNDKVDAGEIGAGHAVTALYEIVPVGAKEAAEGADQGGRVDELRYVGFGSASMAMKSDKRSAGGVQSRPGPELADELLTLKVRYKEPGGDVSKRLEFPLADRNATFAAASGDFKFAAAVAGFGMILRESPHKGAATLDDVAKWAAAGVGSDPGGYRTEFLGLVKKARALE